MLAFEKTKWCYYLSSIPCLEYINLASHELVSAVIVITSIEELRVLCELVCAPYKADTHVRILTDVLHPARLFILICALMVSIAFLGYVRSCSGALHTHNRNLDNNSSKRRPNHSNRSGSRRRGLKYYLPYSLRYKRNPSPTPSPTPSLRSRLRCHRHWSSSWNTSRFTYKLYIII